MWRDPKDKAIVEESSSEEESSSDEESDGGLGSSKAPGSGEMTREQRREAAKLKKQAAIARKNKKATEVGDMPSNSEEDESDDEDMPANPNHTAKARNQARAATGPSDEASIPKKPADKENLSRREREALQAQQAKERYQKLHAEGKTDEARADMARLKLIREQRDAATARKAAEKEEEDSRAAANKEKLDKEKAKREAALGPAAKKAPAVDAKKPAKGKK